MRSSGAEVLLRLISHEAASTIPALAPAFSLSLSRSFARKADGKSAKGMSRGKSLPESQQLKLPEQTLQNFSRVRGQAMMFVPLRMTPACHVISYLNSSPSSSSSPIRSRQQMLDPNWQPALGADGGVTPEEAEEWRQAQRKYSRLRMAELRAWQQRMQGLIRMKKEALEALPPALRVRDRTESNPKIYGGPVCWFSPCRLARAAA